MPKGVPSLGGPSFGQGVAERRGGELDARLDAQLQEHLAQVVLDRLRAHEQLRGDVAVGGAGGDELGDPQLLRREVVDRRRVALASGLAGRLQLAPRPLGPQRRAHALEGVERGAQVSPGVGLAPLAAQPLAVGELGSRALERSGVEPVQARAPRRTERSASSAVGDLGPGARQGGVDQRSPGSPAPRPEMTRRPPPRARARPTRSAASTRSGIAIIDHRRHDALLELVELRERLAGVAEPELELGERQPRVQRRPADAVRRGCGASPRAASSRQSLLATLQRGDPRPQREQAGLVVLVAELAGELQPLVDAGERRAQAAVEDLRADEQRESRPASPITAPCARCSASLLRHDLAHVGELAPDQMHEAGIVASGIDASASPSRSASSKRSWRQLDVAADDRLDGLDHGEPVALELGVPAGSLERAQRRAAPRRAPGPPSHPGRT